MALSEDKNTKKREGDQYVGPVAAAKVIYAGALVAFDASGNITPGAAATTLIAAGRACEYVDNSGGSAGDKTVAFEKGVFQFKNSASTDEITRAQIGDNCYIVDDETVAKTDGSSARSVAGRIEDLDAQGVWVRIA
jgi:hypothetical protein